MAKLTEADRRREGHLLRTYGITIVQYDKLLASQGGVCFICRRPPKKTRLAVDHDHKTGLIRGLLCHYCNTRRLGRGREDPELIARVLDHVLHGAERSAAILGPVRPTRGNHGKAVS